MFSLGESPIVQGCRTAKANVEEILKRVWDNLIARASGPMNFRLIVQPAVASLLAILAGLKDARQGRPTFLWTAITNRTHRRELFRHGRKDVGKVFGLAVLLDAIYQLIVQRGVYVLELLIVATSLAVVPYILLRGPVSRIARWLTRGQASDNEGDPPESDKAPEP
jgi:hypothetical protein